MRSANKSTIRTVSAYVLDANVPFGGDGWFMTKSGNSYVLTITDPLCKAILSVIGSSQSGSSLVWEATSGAKSNSFTITNYSSTTGVAQLANFHFTATYRV